jgi:hypothetical protein
MIDTEFGRMNITKKLAGNLNLVRGRIIATDPILMYDDESYSEKVVPGSYPVYIYVGKTENRKSQTLVSELRINDNTPVKWELALYKGESSRTFSHDEFMGYEVENGLGCFMDEQAMEILDTMDEKELENYEKLVRDSVKSSENSCADILIDKKTKSNIIVFASGWNDGVFPTYYGFDKQNKLSRLVTDFMVIEV